MYRKHVKVYHEYLTPPNFCCVLVFFCLTEYYESCKNFETISRGEIGSIYLQCGIFVMIWQMGIISKLFWLRFSRNGTILKSTLRVPKITPEVSSSLNILKTLQCNGNCISQIRVKRDRWLPLIFKKCRLLFVLYSLKGAARRILSGLLPQQLHNSIWKRLVWLRVKLPLFFCSYLTKF